MLSAPKPLRVFPRATPAHIHSPHQNATPDCGTGFFLSPLPMSFESEVRHYLIVCVNMPLRHPLSNHAGPGRRAAVLGRIRESFELQGTTEGHLVQLPCHEQGRLQLHQVAQKAWPATSSPWPDMLGLETELRTKPICPKLCLRS